MTVAGFAPGPGDCCAWQTLTHASSARTTKPAATARRHLIDVPGQESFRGPSCYPGRLWKILAFSISFRVPTTIRRWVKNSFPVQKNNTSWQAEPTIPRTQIEAVKLHQTRRTGNLSNTLSLLTIGTFSTWA